MGIIDLNLANGYTNGQTIHYCHKPLKHTEMTDQVVVLDMLRLFMNEIPSYDTERGSAGRDENH